MRKTLNAACFILVFLCMVIIIKFIWLAQDPSFFNRKHEILKKAHFLLTFLPCQFWYKNIEKHFVSYRYRYCQEDADCIRLASCTFGCKQAINVRLSTKLKESMGRWERFCWQHDRCATKSYFCGSGGAVECRNNQCQIKEY